MLWQVSYPFRGKCTLKRNSIPLILGCSVSNDQKQHLPSVLQARGPQLESVTCSDGDSCWRSAGNDHGLFLQMQFYFDVDIHFNRLLWSQGWLAVTADWHPLFLSWHTKFGINSVSLQSGQTPCCVHLQGKTIRCKFVLISIVFQSVEAMTNKYHALPAVQPLRHSNRNNKIKNNNSNQRKPRSNLKDNKVYLNYSNTCFNYSLGF